MRPAVLCLALSVLALPVARPASAGWPNSPFTNLPVCTAPNAQDFPLIVSDGAGPAGGVSGAIVVWADSRGGTDYDVYAQHVLASGAVDPAWPADGRALCTAAGPQNELDVVSDGAGGAIVAWKDLRNGANYDVYAQHVLASGAVDPAWPADGRALCTAPTSQYSPRIATDGAGGAIVAWFESRGTTSNDLYAQHVLASGLVDPAWPVDGRAVCTAPGLQSYPQIVSDGASGAILAWRDNRGAGFDIYAQHVLASGLVDPAWPADARALCTAANDQFSPQLVSDGASGAIVAWRDARSGSFYDIYAQHVLASGIADPAWPADGRAVCTAAGYQQNPQLVADGSGGAIVAWEDGRNGATLDLYAQHLLASGAVDPAWPADGRAVCTAANDQSFPQLVSDGAAGAIITWADHRDGAYDDVYAQHVTATGAADPAWPADGRALSTAAGYQTYPHAVSDGAGGVIAAWTDYRSGSTSDVYAQRVARFGVLGTPEPWIAAVADVPNDEGGQVKLSWDASWLDLATSPLVTSYDLLRSVPPDVAAGLAAGAALARPLKDLAQALEPGDLVAVADGAMAGYWEYFAAVTALHYVSGYSCVAPTTGDSLAGSNPETAFMVVARDGSGAMYWPSAPASGWSVDDLAPVAPAPFTGQYAAGATQLHWDPNAEADLAGYRLYRGTSASFTPGPENLVAALADTGYSDPAGQPVCYKLTAVDVHGNESAPAVLTSSGTLDVDGGAPPAVALASPWPNPARAGATLRWTLPRAGRVRLAIHDLAGRLVRELADGERAAGENTAEWDLTDGAGNAVRAGLYFARLEAGGVVRTRPVAVTR